MRVDIFTVDKLDAAKWNQMAIKGSVFQTYEWAKIAKSRFTEPLFFVVKDKDGERVGGFLILYSRIKYLSYLVNTLIIHSEPIIYEKEREKEIIEILWKEIEKYAKRKNIIYIDWFNLVKSRWNNKEFFLRSRFNKVIEYGSHILDISKPIDELWNNLHKKHRNVIRKAEKVGITIEESNNLDAYYNLSKITYERSGGQSPSYRGLKKIWDNLNPKGKCRIFFASHDEKPLAAAFMLFHGNIVFYLHGASNEKTAGASNLLHWEIIKRAKAEGYEWYDFGGASLSAEKNSKARGINMFKERFGGELCIFYGGYKIYSPIRKNMLDKILIPFLGVARNLHSKIRGER